MLVVGAERVSAQQRDSQVTSTGAVAAMPQPTRDGPVTPQTLDATREELSQLLEQALRGVTDAKLTARERARAQATADSVRSRLEKGDFQAGDRFNVTFVTDSAFQRDMLVRDGPSVELGTMQGMQLIPLGGVLRSELAPTLRRHLAQYYRSPEVRVRFLTRVTILGAVGKPGTYSVPPDVTVSDVIAAFAGGLSPAANLDRVAVTRDGREIRDAKDFRAASQNGDTIERFGLQDGDEIRIGQAGRRRNWRSIVAITALSLSISLTLLSLIRSSYAD